MGHTIQAIYENGVLKPLEKLTIGEHAQVQLVIETPAVIEHGGDGDRVDPLGGVSCATGIPDLAEHFDDYRFGRRSP